MAEQFRAQRIDFHGMSPTVTINIPEKWFWEEEVVEKTTRVKVPEEMLKAAKDAWDSCGHDASHRVDADYYKRRFLEAALRWLSENPIVPKEGESKKIWRDTGLCNETSDEELRCIVAEWQRRMFLADPELEVPEEVRDLVEGMSWESSTWKLIIEAFRRGQKSKEK